MVTKEERTHIFILKSLAIFSVVCAHTGLVPQDANYMALFNSKLLNYIGTMGVPVFFVISGYLFGKNARKFSDFWKKKSISIILPWLFCETFLWLYIVLRKGGIGVKEWALFILGYKHTTYYLTVLVICYLVFWFVKKDWQIYIMIVLSVASMISTGWGGILSKLNEWTGTFYLNPFNWFAFFAVGILLSEKKKSLLGGSWLNLVANRRVLLLSTIVSWTYFAIMMIRKEDIYYFSRYAIIANIANIVMLSGIACVINGMSNERICTLFIKTGKYSFSIYLLHQFVAGIVVAIGNRIDGTGLLVIARPFVVIGLVMLGVAVLNKLPGEKRLIHALLGMRE